MWVKLRICGLWRRVREDGVIEGWKCYMDYNFCYFFFCFVLWVLFFYLVKIIKEGNEKSIKFNFCFMYFLF